MAEPRWELSHLTEMSALALLLTAAGVAAARAAPGPEQLSLALTEGGATEMYVTWASQAAYTPAATGAVSWGPAATFPAGAASAPAETHSYTASLGWTGTLFGARMTGLTPGARYAYSVTDAAGNASAPRVFHAAPAPAPDASARIGVLADMGTIQLMGWDVAAEVIRAHAANPYDAFFISGDLSYATVDPPNGLEIQQEWDAWVNQNEPFASTAPFMMTVGNHEGTPGKLINASGTFPLDFAAFSARFRMPRNGPAPDNFLYTWAYGPAFFVSLDSEHDYSAGSAQVTWLEGVLASVDRNVYPWLIVSLHHPILSSDSDEAGDHTPGAEKTVVFSPIFKQYAVDLVVQGHQHVYERTAAVYAATGEVVALPSGPNNVYSAPAAPVYIVQATAGAVLDGERWIAPTNWSLVRDGSQYGFGTMNLTTVGGNRVLSYAFVDVDDVVKDAWQIVKPA